MGLSMRLNSKWYRKSTASWRNCMDQFLPLYERETYKTNVTFFCHIDLSKKMYSTENCNFVNGAQLE